MQDLSAASQRPWHAETIEAALERCRSSAQGLTSAEAAERLNANGPNRLPAGKPRSLVARLFAQFNNLLIYVLIASAGIAFALGHRLDTVVILGVVLVNATIGFIQEGRAEKALDAIRGMLTRDASVLRDGRRLTVPVENLVVGDVALVEAGDRIPADLRLLRASALRIDEAALTGESVAADKATDPIAPVAPLGDRVSMAYSGTLVATGQGSGLVIAIGSDTELGRISSMVGAVELPHHPASAPDERVRDPPHDRHSGDRRLRLQPSPRWCAATRSSTRSWLRSASRSPPSPRACPR